MANREFTPGAAESGPAKELLGDLTFFVESSGPGRIDLRIERQAGVVIPPACREIALSADTSALEIHCVVADKLVRAVFSNSSFNRNRPEQRRHAEELGGRLATREENRAVAHALLEKENEGSRNPAEVELLEIYQTRFVRDSRGGLRIDLGKIVEGSYVGALVKRDKMFDRGPRYGALFILPIEKSQ
ncbi:MAG: hypothetical protein KDD42_08680 [Bdellovibrionales bacterium]|nr:hypothetical protein [Bdellovibrionales bacterium]